MLRGLDHLIYPGVPDVFVLNHLFFPVALKNRRAQVTVLDRILLQRINLSFVSENQASLSNCPFQLFESLN